MSKDGVKTVLSIGSFFLGAGGWNPFGVGAAGAAGGLMGGMMGMSLVNTIWAATHKPDNPEYNNAPSRFDQMMNTVSSESTIPVIYGKRKWAGNQLWHNASTDGQTLVKDILIGEGEVEGVSEVKFNDVYVGSSNIFSVRYKGNSATATFSKDATKITLTVTAKSTYTFNSDGDSVTVPGIVTKLSMPYTASTTLPEVIVWINSKPLWSTVLLSESAVLSDVPNATYANCISTAAIIATSSIRTLFTVKYTGTATTATFSKDASYVYLKFGSTTLSYLYNSSELHQVIAWINSQTSWTAEIVSTTATLADVPNITSANCKGVTVNIKSVAGLTNCSYVFHNGSPTQEPPDNFDVVGGYRRMAWLRCNMKMSERLQGNNPTVTYVVKGLKVLDTRTNVTQWSDNPAMCVRDYLLSKRYGVSKFVPGMVLDEQSFKEAADYCDQLVNYYDSQGNLRQEKRYTLNIILDQKRKAMEHLDAMLATFGGYLVNNNGVISLRVEKPQTPAYHFTNDTIVENSVSIEQLSLDESPNQYKIGYFDTTQNWTQVRALINDSIDQQMPPIGKGKVVTKELTLDGCISQSQALRLGRLYKLKNKLCSLTATWKTTTFAMHLQCGDVVTMTYDKVDDNGTVYSVFTDKPWHIIEISEADGIYSIKAREYNASVYRSITEQLEVKDYVSIDNPLSDNVPQVLNVNASDMYYSQSDGSVVYSVSLSYVLPEYMFFKRCILWWSIDDGVTWAILGYTPDNKYIHSGLLSDKTYIYKVQVENTASRLSEDAYSNSVYINGVSPNSRKYTGLVGDGSTLTYTVNHGLNTVDVIASIRENSPPYAIIYPSINYLDDNNITITFDVAPSLNQYKIVIIS